ncbi:ATP-binding cassette sub-family g member 2-like [Plakobranchus ocellatus]|uniref:ATP-binding cassette sub-family g member 2-like n=1 Tax=Plakobranchus ocellatus TaxID=259542 RepID=A0AAV4A680_9GAST|nr:ATP-binding cassette sub-family g member 2-like [Plakobranchus ocellatus]
MSVQYSWDKNDESPQVAVISVSSIHKDGLLGKNEDRNYNSSKVINGQYQESIRMETAQNRAARLSKDGGTGDVLSFHNIGYTVNVRKTPCSATVEKNILKDVNGLFKPGMNAILGPTGSGKSSLLDVLAGRKDPKGLSGSLLLGGLPVPDNFKCLVGYVVQDDVVMGTLTVRENFEFSARLRLPKSVTSQMRKERVEQVIYELGLTEVADSKVGTEYIRGVSGGERKRCNIGMELIISPPVLFLDEPTTGLDASTANAVMLILKRMSEKGRNIIFSIHQPRFSIFRLFDSLMLLSHGNVVYHGPSTGALSYFSTLGYECEEHNNPPDFFLDVINGDSTAVTSHTNGFASSAEVPDVTVKDKGTTKEDDSEHTQHLAKSYKNSEECKIVNEELAAIYESYLQEQERGLIQRREIDYSTGFLTQLYVVSGRCVKNLARNPETPIMQFFVVVLFACIVGGVYFQLDSSIGSGIQNRVGAFFFIIMNQVFGNMSAVELFIRERTIFIHENVSGFYRTSAYFLAKVFLDLIPMRFIPCLLFSSISYFMIGLRKEFLKFCVFFLTMALTALSASALSFAISSTVKIFAMANLCLALSYVFMMLFSGLLINIADLSPVIRWVQYFSIFRYGLNAMNINELKDQDFCNKNGTECISGNIYLDTQDIRYGSDFDLWVNLIALAAMTALFLILSYIQLRRIKKLK